MSKECLYGLRFGKLVVAAGPLRRRKYGKGKPHYLWPCVCDCGRTIELISWHLKKRPMPRCFNCAVERTGKSHSRDYIRWNNMHHRCSNPNSPAYDRYGGRGIRVCARWDSYEAFLSDMGRRPSAGHSIERIDNALGYQPGNCCWATRTEQNRNRRSNRLDEESARQIRCLQKLGLRATWIGQTFGVSRVMVNRIAKGLAWAA